MGLDLVRSSCGKNKKGFKKKNQQDIPVCSSQAAFVLASSTISLILSAAVGDEQPGSHHLSLEKVQIGFARAGVSSGLQEIPR